MTEDRSERLLTEWGAAAPGPDPALRAVVLRRTGAVLARRRLTRRVGIAAVGLALFAAGWLGRGAAEPPRAPAAAAPAHEAIEAREPEVLDAEALEIRAARVEGVERTRLLRRAGELHEAQGDVVAALDCYERLLAVEPASENARPAADEPWLLLALRMQQD